MKRGSLVLMLLPALVVVLLLFGGGLVLGIIQAMGYMPGAGLGTLSWGHFGHVLTDPDFFKSFLLTLYVAGASTLLAGSISILAALGLASLAERWRILHFIFQIPLTVPHLVIAVAVVFMLAPAGLFSRLAVTTGWIQAPADFPLLINDTWGVGIILAYVWKEIPFITLMILAVLRHSGKELQDVGRTLKAGPWQRFRYITLPIIFPALGAASLIVFAYTFGAFEIPYLLGRTYPMTLPVWAYKNYSDIDLLARPEGIATGMIIALVVTGAIVSAQVLTKAARKRGMII
jgi:putative spermidine/putrescine transport system permease protein